MNVYLAGLAVLAVWLVLTVLLWWLVPIAFATAALGFWQAGAMAFLFMVFGGGIFFLTDGL